MATAPFPGIWSNLVQLTGNSEFVVDSNGTIWLVGNSSSAGVSVYRSTDNGQTFLSIVDVPGLEGSTITFDPALCLDAAGVVHFVGQMGTSLGVQVLKYSFDTTTQTLSGPAAITAASIIGADYDIAALTNGHTYFVGSTLTSLTETVFGLELDADGNTVTQSTINSQALTAGSRLGSVSLVCVDGVTVEVYLGQHQKLVSYGDFQATFTVRTYTAGVMSTSVQVLTQITARHVDDRLTVVPIGDIRVLSTCYYQQKRLSLSATTLLGYLGAAGGQWVFGSLAGTPNASITQPTICASSNSIVLAYVLLDMTQNPPVDGSIHLSTFDPDGFILTPDPDFRLTMTATLLRGTQSTFPTTSPWGFLAQRFSDQTARYFTGFAAAPVATLLPANVAAVRGGTYTFDASQSYSPSQAPLTFSWAVQDPTHLAVLTVSASGQTATLYIPPMVGPAALSLGVSVLVQARATSGGAAPGTLAAATVSLVAIAAPTISAPGTLQAARNTTVTLHPSITVAPGTTPSYQWIQVSGTAVSLLSLASTLDLIFSTAGVNTAGETLVFQLTLSDGTNQPVAMNFPVQVAAVGTGAQATPGVLARSFWSGNVRQRNQTGTWGSLSLSSLKTNFTAAKRYSLAGGYNVRLLIGSLAVDVWALNLSTMQQKVRQFYLPNADETILDAEHTDADYTVVLTSDGKLLQYVYAPLISADSPSAVIDVVTASIDIGTVDSAVYTRLNSTGRFAGNRVLTLGGPSGCLLLQIDDATFTVVASLHLNLGTGLLYGGDNIQWVRTSNVESISSGEILIGSTDANGNTFETLVDLATRRITQTWDASKLRNTTVVTGEVLGVPQDSYSGQPTTPVMAVPSVADGDINLSWSQQRPDLVTSYTVDVSVDGGTFSALPTQVTGGGTFLSVPLPASGHTYGYRVSANSLDGTSAFSNVVTISLA